MDVVEPGFTLKLPDNKAFRLQDCAAYKSYQHLKEMDVCYYDNKSNVLYLVELKKWGNSPLQEEIDGSKTPAQIDEIKKNISASRIKNLWKKSIDATVMFTSWKIDQRAGQRIWQCAPYFLNKDVSVKLLSIINWEEGDPTYISVMNDKFRSKFKPYARLLGIDTYVVLTKKMASERLDWFVCE